MKPRFKIQRPAHPNTTLEDLKWAEERYGIKFINPELFIILYEHIVWRPVMYESELAAAKREHTPMMTILDDLHLVPLTWTHFKYKSND